MAMLIACMLAFVEMPSSNVFHFNHNHNAADLADVPYVKLPITYSSSAGWRPC